MAMLPRKRTAVNIIDETVERLNEDNHRPHLGASIIGHECSRYCWYTFRWFYKKQQPGRILRLFQTGKLEEQRFADYMRDAGMEVQNAAPEPQLRKSMYGGHFSCEIDGIAYGVPESPEKPHVLEFKTYNHKSFLKLLNVKQSEYDRLVNMSVNTHLHKRQHWVQMQTGMGIFDIDRALYLAKNKNDEHLAYERVRFSQRDFDLITERASSIIFAKFAPAKISESPAWYACKFCDFYEICHFGASYDVNCRTCKHLTAKHDGTWVCEKHDAIRTIEEQKTPCSSYAHIK